MFLAFVFSPIFLVEAEIEAKESREVTPCDTVASSVYDYERVADAVLEIENLSLAKSICMHALDQDPENPRLFLVGRILDLEERSYWETSPAEPYFRRAAEKGSKRGASVLGVLYSGIKFSIPRNRDKMIHWLCRSGRRGQYMLAELLDGDVTNYRCPRIPLRIHRAG